MGINLGISGFILPEPKLPDLREPIKNAFEGIFSPIDKLLKSGISTNLKKAVEPLLTLLFEKLKSFLGDLAFVANELLSKTESMARGLIDQILQGVSQLRAEVESMVSNILIKVEDTVEQITQTVTNNLVKPFFQEVDTLRKSLVEDVKEVIDYAISKADQVIDKGDRILTATIDTFRNEALKVLDFFPWDMPWDKDACRFELNIQGVPGPQLATGELYELLQCRRLKRFDEENEVKDLKVKVLQTLYADLQDQAWHLACAARGTVSGVSSALKIEAIEDWIEFGRLHQLWNQFEDEDMAILDALNQKVQELDTKIAQFEAKTAQIDDLSVAVQKAQQAAEAAQNAANNAQGTADEAHRKADAAQVTANGAVKNIDFYSIEAAVDTKVQSNDVVFNFPDSVDAVVLQTISNDHNQIVRANLSQLNPTSFKVHIDGVNGNGHHWIPGLKFLGIKLRR
jgi:uncharacterized protein YoxC